MWFTRPHSRRSAGIFSPSIQFVLGPEQQGRLDDDDDRRPRPAAPLLQLADLPHRHLPFPLFRTRAYCRGRSTAPLRGPCAGVVGSGSPERIEAMSHTFALLVPVKTLSRAKSRLSVTGQATASR